MASATANIATALEIEQMISAAQQIRLVAPADGVAPVSSVIDDTLLFGKPEAKLRCFVEGGSWRSLPALGGVDYDPDPRADYDLILLPSDADPSAIGRLLGQANSPAPVIISRYETLGARADLVLSDWSAQSLSTAILSVMPVVTRVSELPRKPLGPDRNGLSALALAYTRDCSLAPLLRPDDPAVVAYPLLSGVSNARDILEELADAGLLRRRFFERLHICQHCDSSRLHAREVCLKCHSSHLTEQSLIHHYECGYQAVQTSFEAGNAYICPKCRRELRHYGVDYDKPGKVMCCNACGDTMTEPEVEFLCLDCHRSTSGDHASFRDWYEYDLLADGIVAVKSGRLPTADSVDDAGRGRTLRDFRLLVTHSVSVAKRTGRPLCAVRLTVDTTDLANKIGQRGAVSVCEMLRDVAVQSLREQDIAATLGDTVLVCMPETDEAAGKVAADHIQRAIFAAVRPKLKMTVEIFSVPQIDQFLKTVWQ
jgi:Thaumarchaeal output domain 1